MTTLIDLILMRINIKLPVKCYIILFKIFLQNIIQSLRIVLHEDQLILVWFIDANVISGFCN